MVSHTKFFLFYVPHVGLKDAQLRVTSLVPCDCNRSVYERYSEPLYTYHYNTRRVCLCLRGAFKYCKRPSCEVSTCQYGRWKNLQCPAEFTPVGHPSSRSWSMCVLDRRVWSREGLERIARDGRSVRRRKKKNSWTSSVVGSARGTSRHASLTRSSRTVGNVVWSLEEAISRLQSLQRVRKPRRARESRNKKSTSMQIPVARIPRKTRKPVKDA